jgi:hypothetical protein
MFGGLGRVFGAGDEYVVLGWMEEFCGEGGAEVGVEDDAEEGAAGGARALGGGGGGGGGGWCDR